MEVLVACRLWEPYCLWVSFGEPDLLRKNLHRSKRPSCKCLRECSLAGWLHPESRHTCRNATAPVRSGIPTAKACSLLVLFCKHWCCMGALADLKSEQSAVPAHQDLPSESLQVENGWSQLLQLGSKKQKPAAILLQGHHRLANPNGTVVLAATYGKHLWQLTCDRSALVAPYCFIDDRETWRARGIAVLRPTLPP